MAGTVFAQTPSTETGRILVPGATQDQDVVRIFGGAVLERHSNIFRLADGTDPNPLLGKSKKSDTLLIGTAGVRFDREFSLQRLRAEASVNPVKYFTFTQFDYVGYAGSVKLDWALGSAFYGDVGARLGQTQTSFIGITCSSASTALCNDKNLERRNQVFLTGGVRITPNWSVFAHIDHENLDNSLSASAFQASNYHLTGTEAGVRYEPGTGAEIALLGRHTKADYPNLQTQDLFGQAIATPISNNYKQNAVLARLSLRPNEDTRLAGDLGYTKREYDSVPARDFSGPTARLGLDWRAGPGFFMATELIRDLSSSNILTSNYVDNKELRLRPTFVLTGKINLNGNLSYAKVGWKGDPALVQQVGAIRTDTVTLLGLQLAYEYSRVLSLTADVRREHRSSNYQGFVFSNNIVGVGIQARF